MTLIFSTNDKSLNVAGKTFYIKDALKAFGATWNAKVKMWELPLDLDSAELRTQLLKKTQENIQQERANKKAEEAARLAYKYSPEFVKDALKAKAAGDYSYNWICCENCVVLDWGRQHTRCTGCGADYGTHIESFFVRGRLRTGD